MSQTVQLIILLLDAAPEMQMLLGDEWSEVVAELAQICAVLESGVDTGGLRRQVDALLARLNRGPASSVARRVLQQVTAGAPRGKRKSASLAPSPTTMAPEAPPEEDVAIIIPVWYGTCREWHGSEYTGRRGQPAFGEVRVSVPARKPKGSLEQPRWWKLEFQPDPAKHVYVVAVRPLDRNAFSQEIHAMPGDSLVFVHGYNVTFADGARRAAQLSKDLEWFGRGRTMMYSWPSAGVPQAYITDGDSVEWAAIHFLDFLNLVARESGGAVHVIAHSMGNRALVAALERLEMAQLGRVVFAAPDVDSGVFEQAVSRFRGRAQRYTLYSSANDIPLKLSKALHGSYRRAGNAGDGLVIVDGVDTIDASKADTSMLGMKHSYFGDKRSILSDLFELVVHGHAPDERSFDLAPAMTPAGKYWLFRE